MKRIAILIGLSLLCSGCVTSKGRVTLIDFDTRNKDQIEAFVPEAQVVYEGFPDKDVSEELSVGPPTTGATFPWSVGFKVLEVIKGRIRVGLVEWGSSKW